MTYVPFGLLIEVPQIAAFHKKLDLAGEGSSCNARQKKCGWAVHVAYCPFAFSFVSGSKCCLIVLNYALLSEPSTSLILWM